MTKMKQDLRACFCNHLSIQIAGYLNLVIVFFAFQLQVAIAEFNSYFIADFSTS
jgi:hypothetical protein